MSLRGYFEPDVAYAALSHGGRARQRFPDLPRAATRATSHGGVPAGRADMRVAEWRGRSPVAASRAASQRRRALAEKGGRAEFERRVGRFGRLEEEGVVVRHALDVLRFVLMSGPRT